MQFIKKAKNIRHCIRFFSTYGTKVEGEGFNKKIYVTKNGAVVSPWHDIELRTEKSDVFTGFIEISCNDFAKMEVATHEKYNPIMQDTRKNRHTGEKELRYYAKFPLFNYGMLPQTWEEPKINTQLNVIGDNDPLDICELGSKPLAPGSIIKVKVLGMLCLIDQNELDWKILCLNEEEAEKKKIENIDDYNKMNGSDSHARAIREWFRSIKTYDGKKENRFGFNDQILPKEKALEIINECNTSYKKLKTIKHDFWA